MTKYKTCGECKWLSTEYSVIGRKCVAPGKEFKTNVSMWKNASTPACKKHFEEGATFPITEYIVRETAYPYASKTAYVRELVRCKDCKHWWKQAELCTHPRTTNGNVCCLECDANFYCGYGERK